MVYKYINSEKERSIFMRHRYETMELCVLKSATLIPLHCIFILVSLWVSVPAKSFDFVPLQALRQSCTE